MRTAVVARSLELNEVEQGLQGSIQAVQVRMNSSLTIHSFYLTILLLLLLFFFNIICMLLFFFISLLLWVCGVMCSLYTVILFDNCTRETKKRHNTEREKNSRNVMMLFDSKKSRRP
jgi:fatty acid desaturase